MSQICFTLQNGAEVSRINGLCLLVSDEHGDKKWIPTSFFTSSKSGFVRVSSATMP